MQHPETQLHIAARAAPRDLPASARLLSFTAQFTCFTSTHTHTLTLEEQCSRLVRLLTLRSYAVYWLYFTLLYEYKSTNTDAWGAVSQASASGALARARGVGARY